MTWNVRHSTPARQIIQTVDDLIRSHRLELVILQELTPLSIVPPRLLVHRALARATGWRVLFALHPRPYPGWLEGVAILTALPTQRTETHRISPNRTYLQTTISHAQLGELTVGAVHLSTRELRAPELTEIIETAPRAQTILAGDFNLRPGDPALRDTLALDYTADDLPGVDHVYVSRDLTVTTSHIEPTPASDHNPVIATITAS